VNEPPTHPGLSERELTLLRGVFARHPDLTAVRLFGSRAKGTHTPRSDIDLAVWGNAFTDLRAEGIASDLDELPLPYKFDVRHFDSITLPALREHIERFGIPIWP